MSEDGNILREADKWSDLMEFYQMSTGFPLNTLNWGNMSALSLPAYYKESYLDHDNQEVYKIMFQEVYKIMFPDRLILIDNLSTSIQKFGTIEIFNQQFGSTMAYRSKRSTGILAAWARSDGGISEDVMQQVFGLVDFYFSHSVKSDQGFTKQV